MSHVVFKITYSNMYLLFQKAEMVDRLLHYAEDLSGEFEKAMGSLQRMTDIISFLLQTQNMTEAKREETTNQAFNIKHLDM